LQTLALPLGDVAVCRQIVSTAAIIRESPRFVNSEIVSKPFVNV
jgi:hypothetical protein